MTIAICNSLDDAKALNSAVAAHLRATEGSKCSGWSSIYTDGTRFGLLYGGPVEDVCPGITTEEHETWTEYVEPVAPSEE